MLNGTIFTVDDDEMVRTLVREILESAAYNVVSRSDPFDALHTIESQGGVENVSCFILDVEMPGMSGLELLARMKELDATRKIPVIMLTCQSSPEDFIAGYNTGASYYITKPFTREQLLFGVRLVTENRTEE